MISSAPALASPDRSRHHAFDVVAVLVSRDLKILYKRSSLGFGWALVTPLMQVCIFVVVFGNVLGGPVQHYASFVFIGVLVWGWFYASVHQGTTLITQNRALLRQPGFPVSLLPLVTVAVRLFHFSLALPFLVALLWFQGVRPAPSWIGLPLLVMVQFLFTVACAYPLAALNVRLRDTQHLVIVLLQLTMYLTPVFYSLRSVPAGLGRWLHFNPIAVLLESWRSVLLQGAWPNVVNLLVLAAVSVVLLLAGRRFFRIQSRRFAEEL